MNELQEKPKSFRSAFQAIAYWLFLMGIYFGIWNWLGADSISNANSFLFGNYIELWNKYIFPNLPAWNNPFVLIIGGALLLRMLTNFSKLSRHVAAFTVALLTYKSLFWLLSGYNSPRPSNQFILIGIACLLWLTLLPLLRRIPLYQWLINLYRRLVS